MSEILWFYARGPDEQLRRWPLVPGRWVVGRGASDPGKFAIPWDPALSRRHFVITNQGNGARVEVEERAANPVFWQGEPCREFELESGQHFVAGETRFQVLLRAAEESPAPAQEFTLAQGARQRLREQRAQECLQALTRLLPRLKGASGPEELWRAALEILQELLPAATRVLALKVLQSLEFEVQAVTAQGPYRPSRRLLELAFESGQTAVHQWDQTTEEEMTVVAGVNWALAAPIPISESERYALYAFGADTPQTSEQERALIDLVAEALGHFLAAQRAERIRSQVGRFFSPSLRGLIDKQGMGRLMEPERRTVTVLFFDLRGFSKATEQAEKQALETVLQHHSLLNEVMSEVARVVFEHDGIVLDYAGDAVMAGWGAPQEQPDHARRAVDAACEIARTVNGMDLPFGGQGMRCGLGLGTGEVVAGQVGARDQIKYGWIGAVVNQAARLEGLTKQFGVPILMTGRLRRQLGERPGVRRIGVARPAGMNVGVELHEVGSTLSPEAIKAYERAEELFRSGDMLATVSALREVPVEDPVGRFLTRLAYRYEDAGLPQPWDGVMEFLTK